MTPIIILLILLYIPLSYVVNFVFLIFKKKNGIYRWCECYHEKDTNFNLGMFLFFSPLNMPFVVIWQIFFNGFKLCAYIATELATKENFSSLLKSKSNEELEQLKAELAALKAGKK